MAKKRNKKKMIRVNKPSDSLLIYYLKRPELGVRFSILVPVDTYGHSFKLAELIRMKNTYMYGDVDGVHVESTNTNYYFRIPGGSEFLKTSFKNIDWYSNNELSVSKFLDDDDVDIDNIPF